MKINYVMLDNFLKAWMLGIICLISEYGLLDRSSYFIGMVFAEKLYFDKIFPTGKSPIILCKDQALSL